MIFTGTDIIEIERITKSIKNPKFLSRIFSPQELLYFTKINFNPSSIAANFCAKEAFSKAMGTGFRGMSFNEISVLRDAIGAPYISLSGNALKMLQAKGLKLSVSLSHSKNYATAIVIAYS